MNQIQATLSVNSDETKMGLIGSEYQNQTPCWEKSNDWGMKPSSRAVLVKKKISRETKVGVPKPSAFLEKRMFVAWA